MGSPARSPSPLPGPPQSAPPTPPTRNPSRRPRQHRPTFPRSFPASAPARQPRPTLPQPGPASLPKPPRKPAPKPLAKPLSLSAVRSPCAAKTSDGDGAKAFRGPKKKQSFFPCRTSCGVKTYKDSKSTQKLFSFPRPSFVHYRPHHGHSSPFDNH